MELIQDLEFPTASQRLRVSPDGQFLVASGMYPPAVRVYELQEMSLKFERRLTAEVVDFLILSEDVGKLCFLQNDRTLSFHAPYGTHYSLRIPTFGRALTYHPPSCDLYIAAAASELYRLNLEEGRFRAPVPCSSPGGVNVLALNPMHFLLGAGGEDGRVEMFDPRSREALSSLDVAGAVAEAGRWGGGPEGGMAVSAVEFDRDGLTMAVGTSAGHCLLYDLRSSRPLALKEHQYGLPIVALKFHQRARQVLSADSKVLKVWGRDGAGLEGGRALLTNIETPAAINDLCVVPDGGGGKRNDSGLLVMAGEQERIMTYYVPALGPAPRWCSFLDSITEELEEGGGDGLEGGAGAGGGAASIYDDYKFVSREELEELNGSNLIGTPLLRGYMHGFFMDAGLHAKLRAVSQPAAYDEWRKARVRERLEARRSARISFQKALPAVNRALAERLLKTRGSGKGGERAEEDSGGEGRIAAGAEAVNPLGDDRFASLFTRSDFQVDEESEEFKLRNPNGVAAVPGGRRRRGRREGSDEEGSDDDLAVVQSHFREVEGIGGEGGGDDGGEESDENEVPYLSGISGVTGRERSLRSENQGPPRPSGPQAKEREVRRPRFMEAEGVGESGRAMLLHDHERKAGAKARLEERSLPLSERVKRSKVTSEGTGERPGVTVTGKRGKLKRLKAHEGKGFVREVTYNPEERRKERRIDALDRGVTKESIAKKEKKK